jgi:23S rRNA (pseudouridine1915-N3)-methyltransferase
MKIKISLFGEPKDKRVLELVEMYKERISRFENLEFIYLNKFEGAEKYLERFSQTGTKIYLLDEDGKEYTSKDFAEKVYEKSLNESFKELVFAIGPSEGWGELFEWKEGAKTSKTFLRETNTEVISLSKMAMQHDIAFLVLVEQVYRAISIKNNLPYHKV